MTASQLAHLEGDVVVITGASRGLGRATAKAFGARGANVVVNYRSNQEAAAESVAAVTDAHDTAEVLAVKADVSDSNGINHLFDRVDEEYCRVDVFVHNAAVTAFKPLDEVTPKDIALTYDVGIIGVSGNDSHTFMPLHGLLESAKAALETLVRYMAVEQAENGVTVNAVNPGLIDKENYYTSISEETEQAMANLSTRTPKGAVPPWGIAEAVVNFAEPRNEWITGEILHVDGGLSAL